MCSYFSLDALFPMRASLKLSSLAMAIKKALCGRQPGCFYLCPLAVTRDLVLSLVSGFFNKVPNFTYFGLKKLLIAFGDFISARISARYDF